MAADVQEDVRSPHLVAREKERAAEAVVGDGHAGAQQGGGRDDLGEAAEQAALLRFEARRDPCSWRPARR
jgi:hypothetical protein